MSTKLEIDFFENATDSAMQLAYVTNDPFIDVLTGGTASADSEYGAGYEASKAFDNNTTTFWLSGSGEFPHWVKYDLGSGITKTVTKLRICKHYEAALLASALKNFTLQCSNVASPNTTTDWTTIYTGLATESGADAVWQEFTFTNTTAYRHYRINTTDTYRPNTYMAIREIEMSEGKGSLQSYSEATIKTQGSYALKAVAAITDSLNKTLTKTLSPAYDLSGVKNLSFDMRANRTGANVKVGLRNCISNADIDDEDMADITDWTDADTGTGVSSQETFDGKSCMKLLTAAATPGSAYRTQDVGTFGTRTVVSMSVYCDLLGTNANNDVFWMIVDGGAVALNARCASDGFFVYNDDSADWVEVGTNIVVQDTWQEWTFDLDWTAKTADIYLNGGLVGSDVNINHAYGTGNGYISLRTRAANTANILAYVDWLKVGSDFITTELTPTIITADAFQKVNMDLSNVSDANKDAIDKIILTQVNADSATTYYIDNFKIEQAIDVFGII